MLGLLAVRPHSTYELAKAMDRSIGRAWPRAQSKLFEEPKKLALHGYASSRQDAVGRRPRTVYTITPSGRRSLAQWLADPGDRPTLEFEGLVKLRLRRPRHARRRPRHHCPRPRVGSRGERRHRGRREVRRRRRLYEQRRATTLLFGAFLTDIYALVASWAEWAEAEVANWPDDIASHRISDERTRQVLDRARWSQRPRWPASSPTGTAPST